MKIAILILTIIFIIASLLELFFCYIDNEKLRKIFKPFSLLLLSVIAILLLPNHPLIYASLLLALLGDIFLLFKNKCLFILGASSFLLGHILYLIEVSLYLINDFVPVYFYFLIVITIIIFALMIFTPLNKVIKDLKVSIGASLYFSVLFHNLIIFIIASSYLANTYIYLGIIGYLFFITSDLILVKSRFKKELFKKHFFIMLTYLLAEVFITLSFYLTYIIK